MPIVCVGSQSYTYISPDFNFCKVAHFYYLPLEKNMITIKKDVEHLTVKPSSLSPGKGQDVARRECQAKSKTTPCAMCSKIIKSE